MSYVLERICNTFSTPWLTEGDFHKLFIDDIKPIYNDCRVRPSYFPTIQKLVNAGYAFLDLLPYLKDTLSIGGYVWNEDIRMAHLNKMWDEGKGEVNARAHPIACQSRMEYQSPYQTTHPIEQTYPTNVSYKSGPCETGSSEQVGIVPQGGHALQFEAHQA
ncbi:hypothetical protein ACJBU6_01302 [Exserohilum turcicum]